MYFVKFFVLTIIIAFVFSPKSIFAKVIINEVLPYPEDGVELLELVFTPDNFSQTQINLHNWSIWDELATPSCLYTFGEETLAIGELMVKSFSNKLNNSGDSIIIKNDNGEIQDVFTYLNSKKGMSFARFNFNSDNFVLAPPSFGLINNISPTSTLTTTPLPTTEPTSTLEKIIPTISNNDQLTNNVIDSNLTQLNKPNLEELQIKQSQLLEKIIQLKNELEDRNLHTQYYFDKNPMLEKQFQTEKFATDTISRPKVLGVIIGGLLFFVASRLLYEEY